MNTGKIEEKNGAMYGRRPYNVRLPGFISDNEIGLGDAIKKITYSLGIKPCGECEYRAAMLNHWVVFNKGSK